VIDGILDALSVAPDPAEHAAQADGLARFTALFAPAERTLPAMLTRQAERFPDRILFKAGDTAWTFAQTRDIAAGMAAALHADGVVPGDRVAILCGNGPALIQVYLGCAWAGAIAVPINTASRGAQLEHILRNCGARLAVVDAEHVGSVEALADRGLALDHIWITGAAPPPASRYRVRPLPAPAGPTAA
jgi:crotonobetaine/carnitine-CoA ligase